MFIEYFFFIKSKFGKKRITSTFETFNILLTCLKVSFYQGNLQQIHPNCGDFL